MIVEHALLQGVPQANRSSAVDQQLKGPVCTRLPSGNFRWCQVASSTLKLGQQIWWNLLFSLQNLHSLHALSTHFEIRDMPPPVSN